MWLFAVFCIVLWHLALSFTVLSQLLPERNHLSVFLPPSCTNWWGPAVRLVVLMISAFEVVSRCLQQHRKAPNCFSSQRDNILICRWEFLRFYFIGFFLAVARRKNRKWIKVIIMGRRIDESRKKKRWRDIDAAGNKGSVNSFERNSRFGSIHLSGCSSHPSVQQTSETWRIFWVHHQ